MGSTANRLAPSGSDWPLYGAREPVVGSQSLRRCRDNDRCLGLLADNPYAPTDAYFWLSVDGENHPWPSTDSHGLLAAGTRVTSPVAQHLAVAVERHRRWCRDQGIAVPAEVVELVRIVSGGQEGTNGRADLDLSDDGGVPLAYDYTEAGRLLGVSGKTVRRLIDDGELRVVRVGPWPRVPRDELVAFLERRLERRPVNGASR